MENLLRISFAKPLNLRRTQEKQMKIGKGRFINRPSKKKTGVYDRFFVYIPTYVANDKHFPFEEGDEVLVKIQEGRLIIEKEE